MKLSEIWRFPVKSLTGSRLERVVLNPNLGLPHDRRWALARPHGRALGDPAWQPKSEFFVLVKDPALANLSCEFDDRSGVFSLSGPNDINASGNLSQGEGCARIASAIAAHLKLDTQNAPIIVEARTLGYVDSTEGPVSLLNMASLVDLEKQIGQTLDPARFRMNFSIEGGEAWAEMDWVGKHLRIGNTVLHITENTGRCKATHIDLATGQADVNVLKVLKSHFGHTNLGVYAKVIDGGLIRPGDPVEVLG